MQLWAEQGCSLLVPGITHLILCSMPAIHAEHKLPQSMAWALTTCTLSQGIPHNII